jgi:hypothetical protein
MIGGFRAKKLPTKGITLEEKIYSILQKLWNKNFL